MNLLALSRAIARLSRWQVLVLFLAILSVLPWAVEAQDRLSVAYCTDCYPHQFRNEQGRPDGSFIDHWRLWSQKSGVAIDFRGASRSESLRMVRDDEVDAHAGLKFSFARDRVLDFGAFLGKSDTRIFLHKSLPPITALSELSAYRIGYIAGDPAEAFLAKSFPTANVIAFRDYTSLIAELETGRLKAFAADTLTGLHVLGKQGLATEFAYPESNRLFQNEWFIAVGEGQARLLATLNDGMARITPAEMQQIAEKWSSAKRQTDADTLLIAIDWNHPPFAFLDAKGEPRGLLVDFWQLWSRKTGHPIDFLSSRRRDTISAVRDGRADLHAGLIPVAPHEPWMGYTRPILSVPSNLFFLPGETGINSITSLYGRKVGVLDGAYHETFLAEEHPGIQIMRFDSVDQVLSSLLVGTIDAFLGEEPTVDAVARRLGVQNTLNRLDTPLFTRGLSAGTLKDKGELTALLNGGITDISAGELNRIADRWVPGMARKVVGNSETGDGGLRLTAEELAWIRANPRIRVHNETAWPPFNFAIDGKPHGYSVDYFNLLAERVGLKVDYVTGPTWNEFLGMMKAGTLDVMLNIVKTEDRQKYLLYTPPYADNPNTILSRKEDGYENLQQLFGKTVSVPRGFFYEEILKRDFPQIKLHLVDGTLESMKAVSFGKADAAVGELAVFNHLLDEHLMTGLAVSGEVKMGDPELSLLNIATRKDQPVLAAILVKGVQSIKNEELRDIQRRWLGETRIRKKEVRLSLTEAEKAWLWEHKELRLGVDPAYPPYDFVSDDGTYAGVGADYMKLIGERLGVTFKLVPGLSWSEALQGAENGTVDVVPVATTNADRRKYLNFTRPYIVHPTIIITREDTPFVSGPDDFADRPFAVIKGYTTTKILREKHPTVTFREYETPIAALTAVSSGEVDGTALNLGVASYLIGKHHLANLKLSARLDIDDPGLAIGVRKDWPELAVLLDKALASITDEEAAAINAKWISVRFEHAVDRSELIRLGLQIGGVALAIVLVIFIWNRRLQRATNELRQAEAELRAANERAANTEVMLRAILDNAPGGIRLVDSERRYLYLNDQYNKLYGFPDGLLKIGEHVRAENVFLAEMGSLGEGDPNELAEAWMESLPIFTEPTHWERVLDNGRVLDCRTQPTATGGAVAIVTDITELKQIQEELAEKEAQLRLTLGEMSDGLFQLDKDMRFTLVNDRYRDLIGVPKELLQVGRPIADELRYVAERGDYGPGEVEAWVAERLSVLGSGERQRSELVTESRVLELRQQPTKDGGVVAVVSDMTERKRAEDQMKAAKEEAERAAEAKSDFVAVVSHEVRTPMNGVLGMARLMFEQPLLAEQRAQVQTIVDSGEALMAILNDLLDASKLEAGKLELEEMPFAPVGFITDTARVMASRAREKGLNLVNEIAEDMPDALIGDANRLRQILLNFLSNAIKFTDQGSVTVGIAGETMADGRFNLTLSVTDTGVGISADAAEQLFSPYFQETIDIARERGGTGLGLSICRRLADLMGGDITLESRPGEGSTFTLSVPFEITDATPQPLAQSTTALTPQGPQLRILLVEDNAINRKVAEGMLKKLGHKVVLAENGAESLDLVENADPFDIILMDNHMPVMDGIEATRRIRAIDGPESEIPIIALTAAATQRELRMCLDAGMNDVVTKPIDPVQLKTVLLRVAMADGEIFDPAYAEGVEVETDAVDTPVLNRSVLGNLVEEFGSDAAVEFIGDFQELGPEGVAGFLKGVDANDLDQMAHHSHDLKSSSAIVGLARFSDLCRDIELACKAGDIADAVRLGHGMQPALDQGLAALGKWLDGDDDTTSRFIAKISHDLRNTINTMFGYVLLIQESADVETSVEQLTEYARHIQQAGGDLRSMTADMASLLQAETEGLKVQAETVDAPDIARNAIQVVSGMAEQRNIDIRMGCPDGFKPVNSDPAILRMAIQALLGSMVRLAAEHTVVDLCFVQDDEHARLTVQAEGTRLSDRELARINRPFGDIWDEHGERALIGLGFTTAYHLMAMLGGQLEITRAGEAQTAATLTFQKHVRNDPLIEVSGAP